MAQVYKKHPFSKQEWPSDEFGLRRPVIQKHFSGNVLPLYILEKVVVRSNGPHTRYIIYIYIYICLVPVHSVYIIYTDSAHGRNTHPTV